MPASSATPVDPDLLVDGLLREYMKRHKMDAASKAFEAEKPRPENGVNSVSTLVKALHLTKQYKENKAKGPRPSRRVFLPDHVPLVLIFNTPPNDARTTSIATHARALPLSQNRRRSLSPRSSSCSSAYSTRRVLPSRPNHLLPRLANWLLQRGQSTRSDRGSRLCSRPPLGGRSGISAWSAGSRTARTCRLLRQTVQSIACCVES
jgi:hypothetical protein